MTLDPTTLTPANFQSGGLRLMPRGPIWGGPVMQALVGGITDTTAATHAYAANLLAVEADPTQAEQLLSDYERVYGLPDPCTPLAATVPQRRAALLAKIAGQGGQSRAYFIQVANAYGYEAEIIEYIPFRASISAAGDAVYATWQVFVWTMVIAAAGPDAQFECIINRLKPAHTAVTFNYTG